ncbi:MAG: hypothetical protein MJK12_17740 [Colwellia sp.]|nr:hypothetical protein [Colwellia sp.]
MKNNIENVYRDSTDLVGLGCRNYVIAVYIANRPPLFEYQELTQLTSLTCDEIRAIGQECGNGWRKVFNVYAKLLYTLEHEKFSFIKKVPTWQQYRDDFLLQIGSKTALLFNAPNTKENDNTVHIIIGRTYAKSLINSKQIEAEFTWLDEEFAINTEHKIIVCPYFDYRQLSNVKIERLASMIDNI